MYGGRFVFSLRRKVQGEIALIMDKIMAAGMLHLHYKPFARQYISNLVYSPS